MQKYTTYKLMFAAMLLAGTVGVAYGTPPDFVSERGGGPPFGDDVHPGRDGVNGPPVFVDRLRDNGEEEAEEVPAANGPPGLCGDGAGPAGRAGFSHVAHLNFSMRDPETGLELEEGAWGRMRYFWRAPAFDVVFNGHQLPPDESYTLTYQPQPVPSPGVLCLGNGTVNEDGDLHIQNVIELNGDLPMDEDATEDGAMIVLVVSEDVDCELGEMVAYLPGDYLFGDTLIEYVDTDLIVEEEEAEEEE